MAGRVALVTGGSKGIGKAIALLLAQEGATVVVTARGAQALEALVEEGSQLGGTVHAIRADATDPGAVGGVIEDTIKRCGGLDILVNNIGGVPRIASFLELTREDWLHAFELNIMTVVAFVKAALPWLRQSKGGRIINIASITGVEPSRLVPHYAACKAAVINLSKHLADWLAPDGILVNVICPGQVKTDGRETLAEYLESERGVTVDAARAHIDAEGAARIPLGRLGESADVAGLVSFLASDRAAWITGGCFHVDGGKRRSAF